MPPPAGATTLRRAKAQYKKSGPTAISSSEQRRLTRQVELDKRARDLRDRDKRRKSAEKARVEREERERKARKQLGIGLATQLVGYSLSQRGMKGEMEGWLGVGGGGCGGRKRKREDEDASTEVEEKENRQDIVGKGVEAARADDSFGSNMSFDEVLLGQLDEEVGHNHDDATNTEVEAPSAQVWGTKSSKQSRAKDVSNLREDGPAERMMQGDEDQSHTPPQAKRAKTKSSPINEWAQFVEGNTQILDEISQVSPPAVKPDPRIALPPMSTQDLELDSDDFIETGLPKTANPPLSPQDGVIVRDFAYFKHLESGSFTLTAPGAPALSRKSRTERSIRRSFGRNKPTIAKASPKMTATCKEFSAAQCSFTTDYHHYGLSTQILQEALDDGDNDTEDEDEEVYSQALERTKVPDQVLMPPPPITLSPKVFKPPTTTPRTDLFTAKGGLQIFGLSTQLLHDAVDSEDDVSTDEDEGEKLFSIPINRPTSTTTAKRAVTGPSTLNRTSSAFGGFGLSTQMLQEAALDEVELTDDEDTQGS